MLLLNISMTHLCILLVNFSKILVLIKKSPAMLKINCDDILETSSDWFFLHCETSTPAYRLIRTVNYDFSKFITPICTSVASHY